MKTTRTTPCLAALAVGLFAHPANGALIPGLFNTGVDTNGILLRAGQIDPHYTLIESDDPAFPGPNAFTVNSGFPVVPLWWMAEGPDSRWIAPSPHQSRGNIEGNYIYRTTFDLTGFDPTKARIVGRWAVVRSGDDILLNGVSLGFLNDRGFTAFSEFTITNWFIAGTNTIDFWVINGPGSPAPTALAVEMHGTVELPNEAPLLFRQPKPRTVVRVGDATSLTVVAYGTPPLKYQWRQGGANVPGATNATLLLSNVKMSQEGSYTVLISNAAGSVTSASAQLNVLEVVPGVFNTGVDNNHAVLRDLAVDPHYRLITNPDGPSTDAIVHDSTVFPFDSGKWIANSEASKWIAPRGDTAEAEALDYIYRLTFDLSGFDPATALITGRWATDDDGSDIRLNGISTRNQNYARSRSFTTFTITNGFLLGTNKLDFLVFNAGQGPTGLRVDNLRVGAKRSTAGGGAPTLSISLVRDGTILLSWPTSVAGFALESSESLVSANWNAESQPVVATGNRNTVAVPAWAPTKFYRLRK